MQTSSNLSDMFFFRRILNGLKAFIQLGPRSSILYLIYQVGLRSGFYRLITPAIPQNCKTDPSAFQIKWLPIFPSEKTGGDISRDETDRLIAEADRILKGKVMLFSKVSYELGFHSEGELLHWSNYDSKQSYNGVEDIKQIWEPARFDWAIKLACAYQITEDHTYAASFWKYFEDFSLANPLNLGLNWISGQEIALRVVNWTVTAHLLRTSSCSTPNRLDALARSVAEHANRITRTLIYARAQNNNHLISEAAALITAGLFLPNHPHASKWLKKGNHWFNKALISQITNDGEYTQHSTNYHRMMLMLSLWVFKLMEISGNPMQPIQKEKLAKASMWLHAMADPESGRVPNLGHNDGAFILSFSDSQFDDYRPVIQASCCAFCGKPAFPDGNWNRLSHWLGIPIHPKNLDPELNLPKHAILRVEKKSTWAVMRAVHFKSRPAHADQLHVDLWHCGHNIALDAGTFHYNLKPPWENALSRTRVHNTITVNQLDQMARISRFLWLDWAQARVVKNESDLVEAEHDGYRKLGVIHQRALKLENEKTCTITDHLKQKKESRKSFVITLQWLLPDWQFTRDDTCFDFNAPFGEYRLEMRSSSNPTQARIFIVRGGVPIGDSVEGETINFGWNSPCYMVKQPALSIRYQIEGQLPVDIISRFIFN